jgi:hypothetical protein
LGNAAKIKKPTPARRKEIENALHTLGEKLLAVDCKEDILPSLLYEYKRDV